MKQLIKVSLFRILDHTRSCPSPICTGNKSRKKHSLMRLKSSSSCLRRLDKSFFKLQEYLSSWAFCPKVKPYQLPIQGSPDIDNILIYSYQKSNILGQSLDCFFNRCSFWSKWFLQSFIQSTNNALMKFHLDYFITQKFHILIAIRFILWDHPLLNCIR